MTNDNIIAAEASAIDTIKGVGPKKKILYEKMGIITTEDLLNYFPAGYVDYRNPKILSDLKEGETVLTCGEVVLLTPDKRRGPKSSFRILIKDNSGTMEAVFFNSSYLKNIIKIGKKYYFYGKTGVFNGRLNMVNPHIVESADIKKGIIPVYRTVKGISQTEMRKNISLLLDIMNTEEYLPEEIVKRNGLCPRDYALRNLHFPKNREYYKTAVYRKIYEELFIMQLGIEKMKGSDSRGAVMKASAQGYLKLLPFELTDAQKKVLGDIEKDMESGICMNRLVQGDVGSGKTAVAAAAMYKAVKSGYQAVMMAPTEILAKQHFASLSEIYEKAGISVCLLTGGLKVSDRKKILEDIKDGKCDVVIGTHALISDDAVYCNLGLVITDEQHRFGVNQRIKLGAKGNSPHILVMTATPIPRTLAVILYGELSMSVIDALPAGRQEIITKEIDENNRIEMYLSLKEEFAKGRQAYVVVPLIEESESLENVKSTESIYDELKKIYGNSVSMAVVHGDMKQAEKDDVMERFADGEISLLIATSVIEVGIDVPNSTVMVIENAERFGLAQLHQLRGRVGRGKYQSYCYLINRGNGEVAKKRMKIMCSSSDGFFISEKDLELRGPGEIFGIRQHGLPDECIIDAVKHVDILEAAQRDAREFSEYINPIITEKMIKMFDGNFSVGL